LSILLELSILSVEARLNFKTGLSSFQGVPTAFYLNSIGEFILSSIYILFELFNLISEAFEKLKIDVYLSSLLFSNFI